MDTINQIYFGRDMLHSVAITLCLNSFTALHLEIAELASVWCNASTIHEYRHAFTSSKGYASTRRLQRKQDRALLAEGSEEL